MKNLIKGVFLITIWLVIITPVYPYPPDDDFNPPEGKGFFMGKIVMDVLDRLDLSQEQREKIKAIHEERREKTKWLRKEMRENMKALKDELDFYKSDERRIKEIMEKIKGVGAELFETHVNTFIRMKEILTPGQFETFKKEMEKKKEEMRRHWKKHKHCMKESSEP